MAYPCALSGPLKCGNYSRMRRLFKTCKNTTSDHISVWGRHNANVTIVENPTRLALAKAKLAACGPRTTYKGVRVPTPAEIRRYKVGNTKKTHYALSMAKLDSELKKAANEIRRQKDAAAAAAKKPRLNPTYTISGIIIGKSAPVDAELVSWKKVGNTYTVRLRGIHPQTGQFKELVISDILRNIDTNSYVYIKNKFIDSYIREEK